MEISIRERKKVEEKMLKKDIQQFGIIFKPFVDNASITERFQTGTTSEHQLFMIFRLIFGNICRTGHPSKTIKANEPISFPPLKHGSLCLNFHFGRVVATHNLLLTRLYRSNLQMSISLVPMSPFQWLSLNI